MGLISIFLDYCPKSAKPIKIQTYPRCLMKNWAEELDEKLQRINLCCFMILIYYSVLRQSANEHTYVAELEVGFLGTDQERCISNGRVSVLHLLVLLFVFVLRGKNNLWSIIRYIKHIGIRIQTLSRYSYLTSVERRYKGVTVEKIKVAIGRGILTSL